MKSSKMQKLVEDMYTLGSLAGEHPVDLKSYREMLERDDPLAEAWLAGFYRSTGSLSEDGD
jgi:hypothetical protein